MNELNADITNLLHYDSNAKIVVGKVCLVCDKLLKRDDVSLMSLKKFCEYAPYLQGDKSLPAQLRNSYIFEGSGNPKVDEALKGCLVSSRSKVTFRGKRKRNPHVYCCKECRGGLTPQKVKRDGVLPRFAIANGLAVGDAPPCLTKLNEIELALLSQARFRGHLFTYWAGCHRSIKGWHSFYEVDTDHTAAVLSTVEKLTNAKNIAVVLCGPFTKEQHERVTKKIQVNIELVLEAFDWLKENNRLYHNVPRPTIELPQLIDNSEKVDSESTDIELKESMSVVFPDGTIKTGGCSDGQAFEQAIAELRCKSGGAVPYLTSRPSSTSLHDYEDDNLMRAFPLQFPFGYGCLEDLNEKASQNGYLKHLMHLSNPVFHQASFVLVAHNMFERCRALNGAVWRVMRGTEKCNVTEEELNEAISRKLKGLPPKKGAGNAFLESVHAVKKNLAHANEAAQAAQAKFLSLTHHFGCPKALFTVSFDDALDIRVLALSGEQDTFNWINDLDSLSAQQKMSRLDELSAIRCKYPGLCAFNFEMLMDIVLDKIVGDNEERVGMFGELAAYGMAVEEQGRKTLHAHLLMCTNDWNDTLRDLHSLQNGVASAARQKVINFVDSVLSTELVPKDTTDIKCPLCGKAELTFANPQQLRNLRHRLGCQHEQGILARCSQCKSSFEGNELAMMRTVPKSQWSKREEDHVKAELSCDILKSTAPWSDPVEDKMIAKVNYKYNHHLSHHTKTCFKKGDECRALLPDIPEECTQVLYSEDNFYCCDWTGEMRLRRNITVRPKRLPCDAYTNAHCKAISGCCAPANSNIGVTTGTRSAIYCSCYAAKGTQKEDTKEYKKLCSYVGHRFLEQRKENTLFEGLSRLMGSVLVGTSEHVVSAPMASYLVRNQSRFKFSVNFKYIPIKQMVELLLSNQDLSKTKMSILGHDNGCFLTNEALHYLLRPKSSAFNNHCLIDFFEEYEIVRSVEADKTDVEKGTYAIDDNDHPGFGKQVYRRRKTKAVAQFSHWEFPDAAAFGGNIMTMLASDTVNASVENYCRTILVLFHPFRTISDLTVNGSYFQKFKQLCHTQAVPPRIKNVLSNVQMFYNSMRMPAKEDPLNHCTTCYDCEDKNNCTSLDDDDEDDFFDGVFNVLNPLTTREHSENAPAGHTQVSLKTIRKEGGRGCGYYDLPHSFKPPLMNGCAFVENTTFVAESGRSNSRNNNEVVSRDTPSPLSLMTLVYRNARRQIDSDNSASSAPEVQADGTALSILEWSLEKAHNFDDDQKKAFQIVTAAFVLTYYDDAETVPPSTYRRDATNPNQMRHDFNEQKRKLRALTRLRTNEPLRMFLDGPGGSGKSTVVKVLLKHAKEFTSNMNLKFDMRTIIVAALSGVAAVSIGGETLHSVAHINSRVSSDDTSWANARLLVIDEVSFMSTSEVEVLDERLRTLLRKHNTSFGGMNILYCGDFRQLEPTNGTPLHSPKHSHKKWVNSINVYVELHGLWRFKDDPQWGHILSRLRNDQHTSHDIDTVNECLVSHRSAQGEDIPPEASYCVYSNNDRVAINAGIFANTLKEHYNSSRELPQNIIAIAASDMARKPKSGRTTPLKSSDIQFIQENCGDNRVRAKVSGRKGHFVDPLLKLYQGMPLMLVSNDDVPNGHANGTRVLLKAVVLKPGATASSMTIDGFKCPLTEAKDVDHLLCTKDDDPNKVFRIRHKKMTCSIKAPVPKHLGGTSTTTLTFTVELLQFPIIANNATTGHKLQGQTKENMVVSVWSQRRNWNYVALSRVKTRKGLFLVKKLAYNADFSVAPELRQMMLHLQTLSPDEVDLDVQEERNLRLLQGRRR